MLATNVILLFNVPSIEYLPRSGVRIPVFICSRSWPLQTLLSISGKKSNFVHGWPARWVMRGSIRNGINILHWWPPQVFPVPKSKEDINYGPVWYMQVESTLDVFRIRIIDRLTRYLETGCQPIKLIKSHPRYHTRNPHKLSPGPNQIKAKAHRNRFIHFTSPLSAQFLKILLNHIKKI